MYSLGRFPIVIGVIVLPDMVPTDITVLTLSHKRPKLIDLLTF